MGDSFNRVLGEGTQPRLDYGEAAPASAQAMYRLEEFSERSGLELPLLELVKTRVSQINGCAFCIDVHTKDAGASGETEQRPYGLMSAWSESPYYTERERAALAWAEAVTNLPQLYESDEEYEAARAQFSAEELVKLTVVVIAVNGWNRLATGSRETAGTHKASAATTSQEAHMSEAGLELLITLDDPRNAQERDAFNHHQAEHAGAHWSGRPDSWGRHDHRAEEVIDNDPHGDFRSGGPDVSASFQRHDE